MTGGLCDADDAFAQGYAEMEPADPFFAEIAFVQLDPDGESAAASTVHEPDGYLKSIASFEGGRQLIDPVPSVESRSAAEPRKRENGRLARVQNLRPPVAR